jgi:hypothetical protein
MSDDDGAELHSNSLLCFPEKEVSAIKLGFIDLFIGNEGMGMF